MWWRNLLQTDVAESIYSIGKKKNNPGFFLEGEKPTSTTLYLLWPAAKVLGKWLMNESHESKISDKVACGKYL